MPAVTKRSAQPPIIRGRRLRFHPGYLIVLAFMGFFAYSYLHKTREIQSLARQEAALRYANQRTSADSVREQARIAFFRTLPYVEGIARADLGYTKPGEVAVQSQPSVQPVAVVRAAPSRPAPPPEPSWKQWWDVFSR